MPSPRVTPWADTLDVSVGVDIAAEVHVGADLDFTPSVDTFQGLLYGPGTLHIEGIPPGVDCYVRLASLDGTDVSVSSEPVQITAL